MNLTDFRDQLEARAAESDRQQPDPLPVLRNRIRTTKRRRVVVTATGTALAVGVVATVVPAGLDRLGGPEQSPASPAPARPADVVKDGIRFPGTIGGDTLVKAVIGDVGQEFSFDVDLPAGETHVRPVCELPGTTADTLTSTYWVQVSIGGRMQVTSPCGEGEGAEAAGQYWKYSIKSGDPGVNLEGMEPGRRTRITVRIGRGDPENTHLPNPRAQAGVGVYRLGPMRVVERAGEGIRVPESIDHEGHTYRLVDVDSSWADPGAAATVDTPADTPFLVRTFTDRLGAGRGTTKTGVRTLRLTGLGTPITSTQRFDPMKNDEEVFPRIDPVRVEARPAGTATLALTGPAAPNFTMVLTSYRLER